MDGWDFRRRKCEMADYMFEDMVKGIVNSYKEIPRAARGVKDKTEQELSIAGVYDDSKYNISPEKKAIQDMHSLLNYIEKKINGSLTEQEQKEIEHNLETWKKSIEILKKNI